MQDLNLTSRLESYLNEHENKWHNANPVSQLCQICIKNMEKDIESWIKIQGILYMLESDKDTQPNYERALKLHFISKAPDYDMILTQAYLNNACK